MITLVTPAYDVVDRGGNTLSTWWSLEAATGEVERLEDQGIWAAVQEVELRDEFPG